MITLKTLARNKPFKCEETGDGITIYFDSELTIDFSKEEMQSVVSHFRGKIFKLDNDQESNFTGERGLGWFISTSLGKPPKTVSHLIAYLVYKMKAKQVNDSKRGMEFCIID